MRGRVWRERGGRGEKHHITQTNKDEHKDEHKEEEKRIFTTSYLSHNSFPLQPLRQPFESAWRGL